MREEEGPRRIQGVRWLVTEGFLANLAALLDLPGVTSTTIARELSEEIGQEVEESGIRALKKKLGKSSVLVGPLCKLKGWDVPPMSTGPEGDEDFGIDAAALYELLAADPAGAAAYRKALRDRVASLRAVRNLNKK
jgi:hypothetical protein